MIVAKSISWLEEKLKLSVFNEKSIKSYVPDYVVVKWNHDPTRGQHGHRIYTINNTVLITGEKVEESRIPNSDSEHSCHCMNYDGNFGKARVLLRIKAAVDYLKACCSFFKDDNLPIV